MSNFYYGAPHHAMTSHSSHSSSHSHGRSRRAGRLSSTQNPQRQQIKPIRSPKEIAEAASIAVSRRDFDAARSFDLEDDEMFCPWHLLTEDDLQSINSSSSDRSSLSSGSPASSPLQLQTTPSVTLTTASTPFIPSSIYQSNSSHQMKIHQPLAQRSRNAIPIVDPSTRTITSPPPSVSPARQMQQHFMSRRW